MKVTFNFVLLPKQIYISIISGWKILHLFKFYEKFGGLTGDKRVDEIINKDEEQWPDLNKGNGGYV